MKLFQRKIIIFSMCLLGAIFTYSGVMAATFSEVVNFNIDENFDVSDRQQITTILIKTAPNLYFYVEKSWWDFQVQGKQNEILLRLDILSTEFQDKIYPTLTSVFGNEWKPGVDGDSRITVLFHSMKEGSGGYFRSADEYIKLQAPNSNEREMVYLPISYIDNPQLKVFLAHEFAHLITFNQKNKTFGVEEEVWLNEARADYTSTILGYDSAYQGSNLQKRVNDFLQKPYDSLTEWQDTKYDYAVVSLFNRYLVDHYSINILIDSLKTKLAGIPSINKALAENGYKEDFAQIFTNWTIAVAINDCSVNLKYCYLTTSLKNLRINPALNFLPIIGNSSLSVSNVIKNWAGNWQKFIGGNGDLKLEFSSLASLNFQVPYIIYDKDNNYSVKFLKLDRNEKGKIDIKKFGEDYNSLIIIPSLQTKLSGFDGFEFTYPYSFTVSITGEVSNEEQALIQKLLAQIDSLKKQIAAILAQRGGGGNTGNLCNRLDSNLYLGLQNSDDVKCLQNFLKLQGQDIYPEGLVTGIFGSLTKQAAIRFQEKYASEILIPVGLLRGTGYVGEVTRVKINSILNGG
ncbi:MAG: peptidoglycan-binding domain-containing protein [Patescibacteria group bacterium]